MGLLDILRGVADQADFIPGFDPVKDKRGVLSQLLGGGSKQPENPSGTPPIMSRQEQDAVMRGLGLQVSPHNGTYGKPGTAAFMQAAPGGVPQMPMRPPNPADFKTSYNVLDVLNPFKNTNKIDLDDRHRYQTAQQRYELQQAQMADQRQKTARTSEGREAGLQGRELLDFVTSGEVPSIQTITKGDSYLLGNGIQQAPMPFEARTDAFGRTQAFNPNTGEIGEGQGGAKPISLASGAQSIDPITNEVLASNTGMTDYQSAQIANKRAEIANGVNQSNPYDLTGKQILDLQNDYSMLSGIKSKLDEYKAIVQQEGLQAFRRGNPTAARLDALAADIRVMAKGDRLYALGVLAGPDMDLLEQIIPGGTGAMTKLQGPEVFFQGLRPFEDRIAQAIGSIPEAYRAQPMGTSAPAPSESAGATIFPGYTDPDSGFTFMGGDPSNPESWEDRGGAVRRAENQSTAQMFPNARIK